LAVGVILLILLPTVPGDISIKGVSAFIGLLGILALLLGVDPRKAISRDHDDKDD
jgi:hypothetical protein